MLVTQMYPIEMPYRCRTRYGNIGSFSIWNCYVCQILLCKKTLDLCIQILNLGIALVKSISTTDKEECWDALNIISSKILRLKIIWIMNVNPRKGCCLSLPEMFIRIY